MNMEGNGVAYGCRVIDFGVQRHFQQCCSYIVAVSVIGGEKRSTRRKPPTCGKSLTNT